MDEIDPVRGDGSSVEQEDAGLGGPRVITLFPTRSVGNSSVSRTEYGKGTSEEKTQAQNDNVIRMLG